MTYEACHLSKGPTDLSVQQASIYEDKTTVFICGLVVAVVEIKGRGGLIYLHLWRLVFLVIVEVFFVP
jgi:hypothetical protein